MYDPKTGKYTAYQTCFGSHHLQFGYDANETLWVSTGGGGGNVGWINTKMLDETGDIEKSQGWTALVLDTNGNGQRDEYTEPGKPQEPGKDMRIGATFYAVMPSPTDGSVWGTLRGNPGAIVRIDPTKNPHKSLAEMYNVPLPGFGPRGGDIDKQGRVWVSLASGHMGVFDRRLCKGPLNGPKATGNHCPEGWAFHQYPGPGFKGIGENSAESSYYSWVDQHNTFGLGDDIPMSTANLMDGLVALNKDGKMVSIRVPYPLGFYAKGFDGRIDDPNAGWKGRGLWAANGDRTPWLIEGGKGTKPLAAHFQLRPESRGELLHVGRPARHPRPRQRRADVHRQSERRPQSLSRTARWSSMRVPYPLGFYAKGFDGRIDDPNAGWKGRGLWAANGDRTPWLIEGGKGTTPLAAHFQLRPDPLAH